MVFWIHAITIFQVWKYAIIICLFGELPLQFYLLVIHAIFYTSCVHGSLLDTYYVHGHVQGCVWMRTTREA